MNGKTRILKFGPTEVAVVVLILAVLLAVLLPTIQGARESARRMSCSNNFRQIGISIYNYSSAYRVLPTVGTGTGPTPGNDDLSNQRRLSGLVAIVPFVEVSALWEAISNPYITGDMPSSDEETIARGKSPFFRDNMDAMSTADGPLIDADGNRYFPAMGPAPWRAEVYPPWQMGKPMYRCPSDSTERPASHAGLTNYAFNYGDGIHEVGYEPGELLEFRGQPADSLSQRGPFVKGRQISFDQITDGLSETALMAEVVTYDGTRRAVGLVAANVQGLRDQPSLCLMTVDKSETGSAEIYKEGVAVRLTPDGKASRGGNWADCAITWSGISTILPPNSPNCETGVEHRLEGIFSAASNHVGGCHVLMADGAVHFIAETVDTGNLDSPSIYQGSATEDGESPYGVWGALGTKDASESQ